MPPHPDDSSCYRVHTKYRTLGAVGTACAVVAGIASTLAAAFNIDGSFGRPVLAAVTFGTFWSLFTLLGLYLLLHYYRYRLYTDRTSIRQVGVFRDQRVELSQVTEMRWRRYPKGGSVRIITSGESLSVDFDNFSSEHRKQLLELFREDVPQDLQRDRDRFDEQFADTPETRQARRQRTRWVCRICLGFFLAHASAFTAAWVMGMGAQWLGYAVVNVLGAAYLLRRWPKSEPAA